MPGGVVALPILKQRPAEDFGLAAFERNLNTTFEVFPESTSKVTLKLVEAQASRPRTSNRASRSAETDGNEKFSLIFKGPRAQLLAQNTYRFRHAQLGELSLFIVPVFSRNRRHYVYQAIFNRPCGLNMTVI